MTPAVAWNPEFLREGHGVQDTLHPDRLVFGVSTPEAELALRRIYEVPIASGVPVHVTDLATAELAKVAANTFLATKISFINAMAEVSDASGADVVALADILGDDSRIGRRFLDAGIGFGGGCLPKDIRAFAARATSLRAPSVARLCHEVDAINLAARARPVAMAAGGSRRPCAAGGSPYSVPRSSRSPTTYATPPRSTSRASCTELGASVRVYDPEASVNARAVAPALTYVASIEAALTGADLVLHLTDWPEFAEIDPAWAGRAGQQPADHRRAQQARRRLLATGGVDLPGHRSRRAPRRAGSRSRPPTRMTRPALGLLPARAPDGLEHEPVERLTWD